MTYEVALKMFRAGKQATECDVKKELYEVAIYVLEKQIPQKPVEVLHEVVCPRCRTLIGSRLYCGYCGQAIDSRWLK